MRTAVGLMPKLAAMSFGECPSMASAGWDGTVRLWDPTTGRQTGLLQHESERIVGAVVFHPDGRQLATVGRNQKITLWDPAMGKPRRVIQAPTGGWTGDARAAFNRAGTLLAVGSASGHVRLFDPVSGELVATLTGHHNGQGETAENARDVAFSPDGRSLISGFGDGTLRLWGTESLCLRCQAGRAAEVLGPNAQGLIGRLRASVTSTSPRKPKCPARVGPTHPPRLPELHLALGRLDQL